MSIHCFQNTGQHQKELHVLMGRLARVQKIDAVIRGQGPVIVLSGTIHSRKGLLMQQTLKAMLVGHLFQGLHNQLIVVHSHVALRVDGRQLVLSRSHLVGWVLADTPSFQSSRFTSSMKSAIRSRITPK